MGAMKLFWILLLGAGLVAAGEAPRMPMTADFTDSAAYRWLEKKVFESRLLDDMESATDWALENQQQAKGDMYLTPERAWDGKYSLRLRTDSQEVGLEAAIL